VNTESCPVGSYAEDNECVPCPLGFYQDSDAAVACKHCPDGRNTTFIAARNVAECKRLSSYFTPLLILIAVHLLLLLITRPI